MSQIKKLTKLGWGGRLSASKDPEKFWQSIMRGRKKKALLNIKIYNKSIEIKSFFPPTHEHRNQLKRPSQKQIQIHIRI